MDPRVASILKFALFAAIALFVGGFIMKHVNRNKKTEKLAAEMRTLVSDTNFYQSPTAEAAHATLYKGIALLVDAKKLGLEPGDYFKEVFPHDKKDKVGLDDDYEDYPALEKLARDTYERAYHKAELFGMLDTPAKVNELREGKMPDDVIPKPVVACIIDPQLSPGMEKIVPNLDLRPAGTKQTEPTDLETAIAKNLCSDLYSARKITSEADSRISKHYDKRNKPEPEKKEPAKTTPKVEPKTEPKAEEPKAEPEPAKAAE
jgi:hypothetical protein